MATESGYSNQKKLGNAQYKTIQNVGSSKFGECTAQMYLYDITPSAIALVNAAADLTDPKKLYLEITSHGASVNDIVRITDNSSALFGWEYEVIEVVDTDIVVVWNTADVVPAIGDDVKICRWVTAKADSEGALQVSQGPMQFTRNGATQTVIQDTSVPANNRPLPIIQYDASGNVASPLTDTELRASAVPVSVASLPLPSGAATEAKQDTGNTSLATIAGIDFATSAKQDSAKTVLDTIAAKDFATSAKQDTLATAVGLLAKLTDTQPVSAASLPLPSGASTEAKQDTLIAKDFATSAKQDAAAVLLGAVTETAPANDTASSGLNGRLQRIAQRITSLIALVPASLGQKVMASSFAVTIASDQAAIPTNSTPQTISGTVTSGQITVGTSAVRATVSGSAPSATRKRLLIKPSASNTGKMYLGASGVTTANGLEILGPDRLEFNLDASDYYLRSDTVGQTVEIVEVA